MKEIVLASSNSHKLHEIEHRLRDFPYKIAPQNSFSVPEAAETGLTFVENAIIKARNAAKFTGLPAIADDTGLVVDALNGEPGIYSARYAGDDATPEKNVNKLLENLQSVTKERRQAHFCCVIVFLKHAKDPAPIIAQGVWHGSILFARQGENGFGYDPIFFVPAHNCSAAELTLAEKNAISHRGLALQQLLQILKE